MTDRDTFAAAALTGLTACGDYSVESTPMLAWRMADAMLRFRDSRIANTTNHDAAPAATAVSTDDRTDKAAPSQCRDRPGDTPAKTDTTHPRNGAVDTPKAQTTPAECSKTREGTEPVAWAVVYPNGEVAVIAFKLQDAEERATASDRIVPLYRSPTLTDAERAAVEWCVEMAVLHATECEDEIAALRGLLKRTK